MRFHFAFKRFKSSFVHLHKWVTYIWILSPHFPRHHLFHDKTSRNQAHHSQYQYRHRHIHVYACFKMEITTVSEKFIISVYSLSNSGLFMVTNRNDERNITAILLFTNEWFDFMIWLEIKYIFIIKKKKILFVIDFYH